MPGTNSLHNETPKEAIARWSPVDGRAAIETPDGKVYSFDPSRRRGTRVWEERMGFHDGMWLQPALAAQLGKPIETHPAGEYPFTALQEHIEFRLRVDYALMAFLSSLDTELDIDFRKKMARKAERLLEEDEVRKRLESSLRNNPMPADFDTTYGPTKGKAGEILKAMVAKWRP